MRNQSLWVPGQAGFGLLEIQRIGKLDCVVAIPEAAASNTQDTRHRSWTRHSHQDTLSREPEAPDNWVIEAW